MHRIFPLLTASASILIGIPLLHAQGAPAPVPLGVAAVQHVEPEVAPVRGLSSAGWGYGLSGALRVVLAPPEATLEPYQLRFAGDGWGGGHRWAPVHVPGILQVLGEPSYVGDALHHGVVRTPGSPGIWRLENHSGQEITVITQVPAHEQTGSHLNGYHIGLYPTARSGRTDIYAPPSGFIEVTRENRDVKVSEHFTLGQFLTKDQFDVWPKYLVLDLRLIDKLELVIQELNAMGVRAERMHVMSGFRTPQYNGPGGGGRAALSRHMWGDAADVWIDSLGDGRMDDLNGDGRIDHDDSAVVLRAVERVERKFPELTGGAGTYPGNSDRGPYIHIDVRGNHSRW
jgi:uncharacterized protein YcbK (DUF882 family)